MAEDWKEMAELNDDWYAECEEIGDFSIPRPEALDEYFKCLEEVYAIVEESFGLDEEEFEEALREAEDVMRDYDRDGDFYEVRLQGFHMDNENFKANLQGEGWIENVLHEQLLPEDYENVGPPLE